MQSYNVTNLSPHDVDEDLRINLFQERGNDENQVANALQNPPSIHGGPMTKARTKKMKEA